MTTTESSAMAVRRRRHQPVGIYAGAVTAAPTPISDRARDYLNLDSLFTAEELAQRDKVRAFVDAADPAEHRPLVRGRALPAGDRHRVRRARACSACT